jgi:hypothetical protein
MGRWQQTLAEHKSFELFEVKWMLMPKECSWGTFKLNTATPIHAPIIQGQSLHNHPLNKELLCLIPPVRLYKVREAIYKALYKSLPRYVYISFVPFYLQYSRYFIILSLVVSRIKDIILIFKYNCHEHA